MSKWYGKIGFAETLETVPGVWKETITEKPYRGDVIKNTRILQNGAGVNDNINIGNQISIVADPYADGHIYAMRYAEFKGAKWKITTVDDQQRPRLLLTLGGLYNGQTN